MLSQLRHSRQPLISGSRCCTSILVGHGLRSTLLSESASLRLSLSSPLSRQPRSEGIYLRQSSSLFIFSQDTFSMFSKKHTSPLQNYCVLLRSWKNDENDLLPSSPFRLVPKLLGGNKCIISMCLNWEAGFCVLFFFCSDYNLLLFVFLVPHSL